MKRLTDKLYNQTHLYSCYIFILQQRLRVQLCVSLFHANTSPKLEIIQGRWHLYYCIIYLKEMNSQKAEESQQLTFTLMTARKIFWPFSTFIT